MINEEIGEKNPPDKTNWLSVASLNLNYSKIASDIFNVSVVFLIINETHSGNIIFNSIENCYFENLIQTEKYYFPFTVSSIIFNEIKYPISNFQRKDPKIAYNNPLDIGKKGDWTNSPSLFFEERLNIFSFELSSDDDEISIDTILNYEYSSRILISGRLPWICLEILMQLADDSIKEMKGSPVIQLADTNLEFLKDTGIEEPIQGNSLINIGIVVLILGVPMIFTLIWKRNQKKIETNLI